jgi:TonB-linked SusC/RagA family outer membrane protein
MNSDYNIIKNTNNQVVGNIAANYKIMDGLLFRGFAGMDFRYFKGTNFSDPRTADGQGVNGRVREESGQNTNFITNYTLNYDKVFNKVHHVTALAGAEYRSDIREDISLSGIGVPTYQFNTANSAATPENTGGLWTGFKRAGIFGSLKYAYNKKYFASVIMRYDGSSRFGENFRYGIFPSISAGWAISEESFMKNITVINQLKLRASYGQTGNDQIGNFDSRGLYGPSTGFTYNGVAGIVPTALGNSALKWEKNTTINLGIDYALFNGRISGAVDVYQRTNTDLLLGRAVPHTSGYGNISSNVGEMVNKGLEVEITTVNVKYKSFTWKTSFNISLISNKVTKLNEADTVLPGDVSVRLNQPINSNFAARYAGVNPATGKGMWYDRNGNITYLPNNPNDFVVLGNDLSTTTGGLTNSFSYKGLELEVFFQYDFGRQALNSQNAFATRNGGSQFNTLLEPYLRRWQKPGDVTDVPRPIDGNIEARSVSATSGSRFYEDASYIRLKQVTLSYTLPVTLIKKVKLTNVRFYATAINLLTFTKWGAVDPEFVSQVNPGVANTVANRNNNTGVVPQSRNYTIGIQIGF